jgi:hypothetical protein
MRKNKYNIVEELDPDSLEGVSELQKKHYLSLGYKPYILQNGRTKWLTDAQRVYKATVSRHRLVNKKVKSKGSTKRKRRRHDRFSSYIRDNWLWLSLVAISIIAIIVVLSR